MEGQTNQTAPDVYRAICQVAKEISRDGISKNKSNETQHYKFRGIDDIYNALSAIIAGAELCILPKMINRTQDERTTKTGGILFYVTVQAEFDFVSARDGSKHTVVMFGEAMDSGDKATNKAMSAAYKYCCLQVFCIPTEGMEDADQQTHEPISKAEGVKAQKAVAAKKVAGMTAGQTYAQVSDQQDSAPADIGFKALMVRFAKAKERLGDLEYYHIMGGHGFTHANEVRSVAEGNKILQEMKESYDLAVASRGVV